MEQSANQQWKESGTDLTFKEWLNEQQEMGNLEKDEIQPSEAPDAAKIFGINRKWVLVASVIAATFLIYKFTPKSKA